MFSCSCMALPSCITKGPLAKRGTSTAAQCQQGLKNTVVVVGHWGSWGVNLFARFWGTLQNMFLYYFKVWLSCRLVSKLGVSNVETPCQKGLHGCICCYYQWIPVEFQHWFPSIWFIFWKKKSKANPEQKSDRNIHKNQIWSNLIKLIFLNTSLKYLQLFVLLTLFGVQCECSNP